MPANAVLAFGSERQGLESRSSWIAPTAAWHLPMRANVSSLNLATAVSAVLYGLVVFRDAMMVWAAPARTPSRPPNARVPCGWSGGGAGRAPRTQKSRIAAEPLALEGIEIGLPDFVLVHAELAEIGPGEDAGVVHDRRT